MGTKALKFRRIFFDGSNGMMLGEIVTATPVDETIVIDDIEYISPNEDGLYEDTEGEGMYLVPMQ